VSSEPDAARRHGIASGTVLALGFTGAAVVFVLFLIFVSPLLREQVLRTEGGLSERDVLGSGTFAGGQEWVVAAVLEDGRACVVGEIDGEPVSSACAAEPQPPIGEVAVMSSPADPTWLATGVLATDVTTLQIELVDGTDAVVLPRRAGSGVAAGFWFSLLDGDAGVRSLSALGRSENLLDRLTCEPAVVTRNAVADRSDCQSGGQG